jgi:hypothetical protein
MNPAEQSSSVSLDGFNTNVEQLVKALETNNQFSVDMVLMVITKSDYTGHLWLPVAKLSDPDCLARLINPLKTIEANLKRANRLTGKSASPVLPMLVCSQLKSVQSILADVQKRSGSTNQKEEKKKWWQIWK